MVVLDRFYCINPLCMCRSRGWGDEVRIPPRKSQVAIGFLRNTGTNPPGEAIGPQESNFTYGRYVGPRIGPLCEIR